MNLSHTFWTEWGHCTWSVLGVFHPKETEGFVTSIHFRRDWHEQDLWEQNIPLCVKERQERRKRRMDREEKEGKNDSAWCARHTKAAFQNNRSYIISRAKQTGTLREQDEVTCTKVTWLTPSSPSQIDHTLQFSIILFFHWSLLIILDEPSSTRKVKLWF